MSPSKLLLAAVTLLPIPYAAADSSFGLPLFSQTVAQNSRISEGYAKPEEKLNQSIDGNLTSRHHTPNAHLSEHMAEIWVSDITTVLFNDADNDGYYAGFSLTLDADVAWDSADIYANIYLQSSGSRAELFHTTNVFNIIEQHSADRYRVDVELDENFHAGDYDLIVDVLNAYDAEIEDTVSHRTHNNLSRLPLESHHDQQYHNDNDYYDDSYYADSVVTTFTLDVSSGSTFHGNHHSGSSVGFGFSTSVSDYRGAGGWGMLLLLATACLYRTTEREDSTKH